MILVDTALHGPSRPLDLSALPRPGLGEHGQQDDSPSRRDVVGDPGLGTTEVEPQLAELALQLPSEGLAKMNALLRKQVDVPLDLTEVLVVQRQQPIAHLGFGFDHTPAHSTDAMGY